MVRTWRCRRKVSQIRDMSARPHPVSVVRPPAARITDFTDDIMHVLPFYEDKLYEFKNMRKANTNSTAEAEPERLRELRREGIDYVL